MRRAAVTLALMLCVQTATAQTAGYRLTRRPRMGLVWSGVGLLVGGWAGSLLMAIELGFRGLSPVVLIPLAGPFVGLGSDLQNPQRCPLDAGGSCDSTAVNVGLVTVGALQVLGAGLLAAGMVPHEVKTKVTVTPTFGWHGGPFAGISGRF